MKRFLLLSLLFIATAAQAQETTTGSIAGKLSDREMSGEPLPFANVLIKGTTKGTTSDYDGLYILENLEPGTYTVVFSFIGYETLEVPDVVVEAGKVTEVNTDLGSSAAALDEVVITTVSRRDSEVAILMEQKNSVDIKTSIGAQELAKKGVGDAEGAVTKISGISKQQGVKNVFVRGLGDRYNSTTFNGLPLPSEDPEYKNIALDYFGSNIINSVGVNKTFSGDIYGDVAGANIDIDSKTLTSKDLFKIGFGTGFNSRAVTEDFMLPDGSNWLGFDLEKGSPINNLGTYSFINSFNPNNQNTQVNSDASIQLGKKFDIGDNQLSAMIIGSFESDYTYQKGNTKELNAQGLPLRDLDFDKYLYSVSQIAMGNLDFEFVDDLGSIAYNSLLIHTNTQSVGQYFGQSANISEEEDDSAFIRRQQINDNTIYVNQLLSEFNLTDRLAINLDAGYNITRGDEPDRRQNTFVYDGSNYRVAVGTPSYNHRFYSQLEEDELVGNFKTSYKIGDLEGDTNKGEVSFGYNYKDTDRIFNFLQFNHDFGSPVNIDINNPDAVFNQQGIDNGDFRLVTNSGFGAGFNPLVPFFYEGNKTIHAGFANFLYTFNEKFSANIGLRYEDVKQTVNWDTNLSSSERDLNVDPSTLKENYFLPSLTAKYNFNENSILRFAGSKTYTFPQFKEVAPFLYEDVNFSSFGNPDLMPSEDYNFDLKYEYYFSSGELVSLTGFYKKIIDPINRAQVNSAANQLSYINSGEEADVAGLELELRKDIFEITGDELEKDSKSLSFGLNASYLYSRQDLTDESTNFTNDEDELQGASPFLLNTDLTFDLEKERYDLLSSFVLNYFSDRIYSLGVQQQGNIIEKGIPTLDYIAKLTFDKHFGINFKAANLLDPSFELTQEDISGNNNVINTYKRGSNFSLGFTYTF